MHCLNPRHASHARKSLPSLPLLPRLPLQTHAILLECYNPVGDVWDHVELPPNANPRRSFLAACGIE